MLLNPSLPIKTVPEFIAYAKANRVLYGSPGVGNLLHLTAELFNLKAGIQDGACAVPWCVGGAHGADAGQHPGHVRHAGDALSLVQEGKLRAIGFNGRKPFPELAERAAGQRVGADHSAVEHLGHLLRASEDSAGDRRQAQWRASGTR